MAQRHAVIAQGETGRVAHGGAAVLRADEVSRFAVRLVVVGCDSYVTEFARLPELLHAGDLVVVNDAATLPGSLHGTTARGEPFELRLSAPIDGSRLFGALLGAGDHRTRTEDRPRPPPIAVGERVCVAGIEAIVAATAGRRVELVASVPADVLWHAIYAGGAPVQYAHRPERLPLHAVQTAYAARPWAAEMPSAGRPLTWDVLLGLRRAGIELATLTHAAGLSSTGDLALDRVLPWPERYEIPQRTFDAIERTHARGGRVIAVGTTVVRALESAHEAGAGTATLRLDGAYRPRVVDGLVSGLHVPGESHFELLSAFAPPERLAHAMALAAANGLSAHELGDACLVLRHPVC
jgi:S-adenosylmethionine:tRNA ribosyltransferase-isomerase